MAKVKRLFKAQRQHRYEVFRKEYFTKTEAMQLSYFKFKQPYIRRMRVDRRELVRGVKKLGLSRRKALIELRWQIRKVYEINAWPDAYAMMRDYRNRAIERGEYIPPPARKRPRLSKGNVRAQKERYRARQARRKEDRTGVRYDSEGKVIGHVEYNPETGRFEARYD